MGYNMQQIEPLLPELWANVKVSRPVLKVYLLVSRVQYVAMAL